MTYTFQQLYSFYLKGAGIKPEYTTLAQYISAYRKAHNITSTTEVEFDNSNKPISK